MPLDAAALAATIVGSYLVPLVKAGATKLSADLSEKIGAGAADHLGRTAVSLWERVKDLFRGEDDKHMMEEFQDMPDEAAPLLAAKLRRKLEADPSLAEALYATANSQIPGTGATGAQIMNASTAGIVDLRGAQVTGSGQTFTGVHVEVQDPSRRPPASPSLPSTADGQL